MNAFSWRGPAKVVMQEAPKRKRGRPQEFSQEEAAERRRAAALRYYHKTGKQARRNQEIRHGA